MEKPKPKCVCCGKEKDHLHLTPEGPICNWCKEYIDECDKSLPIHPNEVTNTQRENSDNDAKDNRQ